MINDRNNQLDIYWSITFHLPKPRSMWSGCMQLLHSHHSHPGQSSSHFLPVLDLTPSDPTCVRSTLEYISDHAIHHNITLIITFDQQLWWIAFLIIESQPSWSPLHNIFQILGGFYTQMSFLGTIGHLMAGTGLKDAMTQEYAEGSVDQMLSGKSVARAVRAHLLVDGVLNTLASSLMCGILVPRLHVVEDKQQATPHDEIPLGKKYSFLPKILSYLTLKYNPSAIGRDIICRPTCISWMLVISSL